jgi:hypothetical protein
MQKDVILKASHQYALMLVGGLIENFIRTLFESVASLKEEIEKIVHAIE